MRPQPSQALWNASKEHAKDAHACLRRLTAVDQDINVLALVKGNERYVFLYDDRHRTDALRALGRFASDPELSFNWFDAAVLGQKVHQIADESRSAVAHERFKLPNAS